MVYDLLFDWQKKLVDSIKNQETYGLFLDMGLGKTPISVALTEVNKVEKVLVITINSKATEKKEVNGSWLEWFGKSDMKYVLTSKADKKIEFSESNQVFLVNYEYLFDRSAKESIILRDTIDEFIKSCKGKRCAILIDESHKMKESKSNQTKAINKIYALMKVMSSKTYLYLLSGTPFTKGYIDLWTQLKILGINISKTEFKNRFCVMGNVAGLYEWQQPIVSYQNIDDLFELVHQKAITIESKEVIQLPEQIFNYITYPMTNSFKLYLCEKLMGNEIKKELDKRKIECNYTKDELMTRQLNPFFRNIDYPEFNWTAETPSEFWLRARELSIGFQGNAENYKFYDMTRFKMLEKFLSENEDNYLLFYSYTPELIEIYTICERLGYNIDIYSGEIKNISNYEIFSKMPREKKIVNKKNILISNWASGSTGMNFQEYNKCIIFDLPVYKDWQQGIKRIHRTGQKNTCFYYVFMQNCFLDKNMLESIRLQQDYTKNTFESDLEKINKLLK